MNVRSMEYLLALEQEGTLSAAARLLGISQPTLSVFLSGMERQLGLALFRREGRRMIPTEKGLVLLAAAREIVTVKEQTYQAIRRLTHRQSSRIVIGASPLRGSLMVAQIMPAFNRRFPDVELVIREGYAKEIQGWVHRGEVDFALASYADGEEENNSITTAREEMAVAVPRFHPLAVKALAQGETPPTDIRCFGDSPFILMARETTSRRIYDRIMEESGLHPTVVYETNNMLVICRMVSQGMGAAVVTASTMSMGQWDMVCFPLDPPRYMHLGLLRPPGRTQLTQAQRYLAYLVIREDMKNALYLPGTNDLAREILQEFGEEDGW